jgi:hypothetical protein
VIALEMNVALLFIAASACAGVVQETSEVAGLVPHDAPDARPPAREPTC